MRLKTVAGSWVVLFGMAGALVAPPVVVAQSDGSEKEKKSQEIEVRATFDRANRLAGRGALTRSISAYEKVIEHGWEKYPSAHYNFAEVLKAKEEYGRALLHYQAYVRLGESAGTKDDARRGLEQVEKRLPDKKLARLSVEIEPEAESTIAVDGVVVAQDESVDELTLLAGEYEVRADAVDHRPATKKVTLEREGSASVTLELTKRTFFGGANVSVDEPEATVKFHPEELEAPGGPDEPVVRESPLEEAVELQTGKWLLEVTKPEYRRWVRYIQIKRDKEKSVEVTLEKKLPEEIR